MNPFRTLGAVALCTVAWTGASHCAEEQFDAVVVYTDARADTVFDVFEYSARQPVRTLCYLDGDARPQIPYAEIETIAFSKHEKDSNKIAITISLRNKATKKGTLWFNDSFFGTTKDGSEWRGRIVNLASMTLIPSKNAPSRPAPSQRSAGRG